jgi:hypothetical protein
LLVEGIEAFGASIEATAQGGLTRAEARQVARGVLFHHEAYHNAVETFAVRLEVTHRAPCYRTGLSHLYRTGFNHCSVHEEGLATAYATIKACERLFPRISDKRVRKLKRRIAYKSLEALIRGMPDEYKSALNLLPTPTIFDKGEHTFQEAAHQQCLPHLPAVRPEVWASSLHAMGPSLQRNKSFSYVIRRSHPALRGALNVRYLSIKRKHFLQRLRETVGGKEIGGGRHPKWMAEDGRRVPVPSGTDLNPYTCAGILRQLGLADRISEFMQK